MEIQRTHPTVTEMAFLNSQQMDIVRGYVKEKFLEMKIKKPPKVPYNIMRRYNLEDGGGASLVIAFIEDLLCNQKVKEEEPAVTNDTN